MTNNISEIPSIRYTDVADLCHKHGLDWEGEYKPWLDQQFDNALDDQPDAALKALLAKGSLTLVQLALEGKADLFPTK